MSFNPLYVLNNAGSMAPMGPTNPGTFMSQIRQLALAGQAFYATTGILATGVANAYGGIELLAHKLAKNVLIYNIIATLPNISADIRLHQGAANTQDAALTASLPATSQGGGSVTSLAVVTGSPANTTQVGAFVGTYRLSLATAANNYVNLLIGDSVVYIPANTDGFAAGYVKIPTSGNTYSLTMEWIEF